MIASFALERIVAPQTVQQTAKKTVPIQPYVRNDLRGLWRVTHGPVSYGQHPASVQSDGTPTAQYPAHRDRPLTFPDAHCEPVKKQMDTIHRSPLQSGYLTQVRSTATMDEDGLLDWLLHDTSSPKAKAADAPFIRQPGAEAMVTALIPWAAVDWEDLAATVTREFPGGTLPPSAAASTPAATAPAISAAAARPAPVPAATPTTTPATAPAERPVPPAGPLRTQAEALVRQFSQRFHGLAQVTPHPKELAHATELLTQHGEAKAHFLLAFAHHAAPDTAYQLQVFGGILPYLPRALAAYEARATQASTQRAVADERTQREQYQAWEHHQLAHLRAARPPAELAALAAAAHAQLVAEGTPEFTLRMGVRAAVDTVLAAQAGLPTFDVWRQTPEAGRGAGGWADEREGRATADRARAAVQEGR